MRRKEGREGSDEHHGSDEGRDEGPGGSIIQCGLSLHGKTAASGHHKQQGFRLRPCHSACPVSLPHHGTRCIFHTAGPAAGYCRAIAQADSLITGLEPAARDKSSSISVWKAPIRAALPTHVQRPSGTLRGEEVHPQQVFLQQSPHTWRHGCCWQPRCCSRAQLQPCLHGCMDIMNWTLLTGPAPGVRRRGAPSEAHASEVSLRAVSQGEAGVHN